MGILRRFDMQTNLNLRSQIIGIPARRTQRQRQARRHAQSKIDEEKKAADDSAGQQADSAVRESTPDPLPKASRAEIPKIPPSRRESSSSQKVGLLQGVLEETRLISWPTPVQALKDTATVVALVALLATVLFALNTALTEGSKQLYSLRDPEHPLFSRKN